MAGSGHADQVNLTDEESRVMKLFGGSFEQCYNAQALVAVDSLLVVAQDVAQEANDKRQVAPMGSGWTRCRKAWASRTHCWPTTATCPRRMSIVASEPRLYR